MRKAHDPIMMGNATAGSIPSTLTSTMHGAYRPTPSVINAPSTTFVETPMTSFAPVSPTASPPGTRASSCASTIAAAPRSAIPIPTCTFCRAQPGDDPGAQPGADAGRRDHEDERDDLDVDGDDEDQRLNDRGHRVPHVQRSGNLLVSYHLPELERGGRRGKAADAERVPEIGDEPDAQVSGGRSEWLVGTVTCGPRSPQGKEPHDQEDRRQDQEPGEQQDFDRQGLRRV